MTNMQISKIMKNMKNKQNHFSLVKIIIKHMKIVKYLILWKI